jgi:hypothetical protein
VRHFARIVLTPLVAGLAAVALTGCGSSEQAPADSAATTADVEMPSVQILSPADGDTVSVPFTITLGASGVEVVPATGVVEEGKGHHHILIDGEEPSDTLPLPPPPVVIHLGNGASEKLIEALEPGPHRIIAIFATGDHVPMAGVRRDTINIVVR